MHVTVAPLLVGQADAPRFLGPAAYPGHSRARIRLVEARLVGDVVLLRYFPKERSAGITRPDDPEQAGPLGDLLPERATARYRQRHEQRRRDQRYVAQQGRYGGDPHRDVLGGRA
jgi:hypothetical protein